MLNEGMDPNAELPVPVPVAFQKRFTDEHLRYYLSSERGFTALMLATVLGNHKFVDILLSAGADPWKLTKRHKTYALWLAAKYKNIEIMRSLMGIGANHESRAFRITIDLSEQKAFLWRNRRIELVTPDLLRDEIPSYPERTISHYQQIQVLEIDTISARDAFLFAAILRRFWPSYGQVAWLSCLARLYPPA
jgi:Ankyrin repeat